MKIFVLALALSVSSVFAHEDRHHEDHVIHLRGIASHEATSFANKVASKIEKTIVKSVECSEETLDTATSGTTRTCSSHLKQDFSIGTDAKDIKKTISKAMADHFETFSPESFFLLEDDDDKEVLASLNQVGNVQAEKTFEYVGNINVDWSCKLTYSYKDGKLARSVDCSASSDESMVPKNNKKEVPVSDFAI